MFYCDIDLRSDSEINVPAEVFVKITQELLTLLKQVLGTNEAWKVILTKRTAPYYKKSIIFLWWISHFNSRPPRDGRTTPNVSQHGIG